MGADVRIEYDPALPITAHRHQIVAALASSQVLVVAGETGSGKTTQLPKMCLEAGRGAAGRIGHTQPRRLAARTVAERLAEELSVPLGGVVGYQVRFTDQVSEQTAVKVMTDGILLAELRRDRQLRRYDTLIIDEAHERSLNIDFLLGYLRQLLPRRPDLKLIVTSATIDTARFASHFGDAPVIEVSGRGYPVEIRYRAPADDPDETDDPLQAVADAVVELNREGPGDILVFLSGEREIRDAAEVVRSLSLPHTEVLPLYARLSAAVQHRAFRPHQGRRIVLATNVAESSLTVPGIRYVVDLGTARISRYNRRTKMQRLPIEPVSRASADQRAGRCGRLGPGVCIRLYSEQDYLGRPEFTEPEILRTNLASVILQMTAVGLGAVERFPFLDPPDSRAIRDGVALLEELGAFAAGGEGDRRLSPVGRRLAQLPLDPRYARMLVAAEAGGCLREVTIIAAGLSIIDPRERPADHDQEADRSHARFAHRHSDLLSYLALWGYLQDRQAELTPGQFRRLCRREFLNYRRVREWQDLAGQLRQIQRDLRMTPNRTPASEDAIHQAVLSGLLSHVGTWDQGRRDYSGARQSRFAIAPGSVLFRRSPRWVMAADLVETTRLWARNVAVVRPEWIERLASHLVKRSYGEPVWDPLRGAAVVPEQVTLYGLSLVSGRRVDLARLDPAEARGMFIENALVHADWDRRPGFVDTNLARLEELASLEDRLRRRDVTIDAHALAALYDARLPEEVCSGPSFERWWRRSGRSRADHLLFGPELLVRSSGARFDPDDFPDQWRQGELCLELEYRFSPGDPHDGVTVVVPLEALNQLRPSGFDWHVPGWREELATSLIRSLAKPVRRQLGPAGDLARAFLASASPDDGPLLDVLASYVLRTTGVMVRPGDFHPEHLAAHLRVRFRVVGTDGAELLSGSDLDSLKARLQGPMQERLSSLIGVAPVSGGTEWGFGEIPRVVERTVGGRTVRGYPSLVDEGETVGLRILTSPDAQAAHMWTGTRRLVLLALPGATADLERRLPAQAKLALTSAPGGAAAALIDCMVAAVDALLADLGGPAWDEAGFVALVKSVRAELPARSLEAARTSVLRRRLDALAAAFADARHDMADQLDRLVPPGFATRAGLARLPDVERYLIAVERRLDRIAEAPRRDEERMAVIHRLEAELASAASTGALSAGATDSLRWMLEELRVGLWAQTLGTAGPVSEQRFRRALAAAAGTG